MLSVCVFIYYIKLNRLRVFENMVARKIFEPKRYEETGDWRRSHSERLHDCASHQILSR
jgi:hypothetical protein